MVHNSATENALVLNPAKCKALIISPSKQVSPAPTRILAEQLNTWNIGGCGTFQPPCKAVDNKARRAYILCL